MTIALRAAAPAKRAEPTGIKWGTVRTDTGTGDLNLSAVAPVGSALVLCAARAGGSATSETLDVATSGWTLRHGPIDQGTARRLYVWTARHTGSLPTTVTATKTAGTGQWRATLAVVWNADFDVSAAAATANSTSHTIPSVTTTEDGDLGLAFLCIQQAVTEPASWAERSDPGTHLWLASRTWGAAGATGTATATVASTATGVAAHVALKAA